MSKDEDKFLEQTRRALDRTAADLDMITTAKLRAARLRALDAARVPSWRRPWLVAAGGLATTALVAVVAGLLWLAPPATTPVNVAAVDAEDVELLDSQESPDFYADLDFYDWLANRDNV
jgi:ferric-dicitrate binding protein FerR (iron transport regulator)